MAEDSVKRENIFDNEYMAEQLNRKILRLNLELMREYEDAKRSGYRAIEEGKLVYRPMLDKIR